MNYFMKQSGIILAVLIFIIPVLAHAALVNINTADATLLDTLPNIGPTYAGNIVAYRTQHGPFAKISDIQNVSGIGPVTYAKIAPYITVSDSNQIVTTTIVEATSTSSGGSPSYVPPPPVLTVDLGASRTAFIDVPFTFTASVKARSGASDLAARIVWSFGDGSAGEGTRAQKTYRYAGAYLVIATATDGPTTARGEMTVTVEPAVVRIASISTEGITLANDSDERLDLSGWRLMSGTGIFSIPLGMSLLPHASVLFPFTISNLPIAFDASLAYPDGVVAARYMPNVQPSAVAPSSLQVQEVDPLINISVPAQAHDEAVNAPAAASTLAAAGAASASSSPAYTPAKPSAGLLHSPWTYSLFGIIALAGGAFILL